MCVCVCVCVCESKHLNAVFQDCHIFFTRQLTQHNLSTLVFLNSTVLN